MEKMNHSHLVDLLDDLNHEQLTDLIVWLATVRDIPWYRMRESIKAFRKDRGLPEE